MAFRLEALKCYRELLRTARQVFSGDNVALRASHQRIRNEFVSNRNVADKEKLKNLLAMGYEASSFLRKNVVQAVHVGDNKFSK